MIKIKPLISRKPHKLLTHLIDFMNYSQNKLFKIPYDIFKLSDKIVKNSNQMKIKIKIKIINNEIHPLLDQVDIIQNYGHVSYKSIRILNKKINLKVKNVL